MSTRSYHHLLVAFLLCFSWQRSTWAQELPLDSDEEFSVGFRNNGPIEIAGMESAGAGTDVSGSNVARGLIEFDVRAEFPSVPAAVALVCEVPTINVDNPPVQLLFFEGDGEQSEADFNANATLVQLVDTSSVTQNDESFVVDVTSAYDTAVSSGFEFLAFRIQFVNVDTDAILGLDRCQLREIPCERDVCATDLLDAINAISGTDPTIIEMQTETILNSIESTELAINTTINDAEVNINESIENAVTNITNNLDNVETSINANVDAAETAICTKIDQTETVISSNLNATGTAIADSVEAAETSIL